MRQRGVEYTEKERCAPKSRERQIHALTAIAEKGKVIMKKETITGKIWE